MQAPSLSIERNSMKRVHLPAARAAGPALCATAPAGSSAVATRDATEADSVPAQRIAPIARPVRNGNPGACVACAMIG